LGLADSSAVGRGLAEPRPTALLQPISGGKPEAAAAVVLAPDDGHKDARNMLSCSNKTPNQIQQLVVKFIA
jgi:hypothetical protein